MSNEEQAPATREDLRQLKTELLEAMRQSAERLKTEILETTQEQVRDAQTEILRGFQAFVISQDTRIAKLQGEVRGIDTAAEARFTALEQRLMQIEAKLLLNPPRTQ